MSLYLTPKQKNRLLTIAVLLVLLLALQPVPPVEMTYTLYFENGCTVSFTALTFDGHRFYSTAGKLLYTFPDYTRIEATAPSKVWLRSIPPLKG